MTDHATNGAPRIVVGVDGSPGASGMPQPVTVLPRVVEGHPAQVLLRAADGAQLLVVGSRGHGTFAGIMLGSVSQHCVQHAPCPVVVVPQPLEGTGRPAAQGDHPA